jgi:glycosyltransferase involved in cell wall biosynthesis
MRTITNLVFWQGAFSIHQSALLRNLASSPGITVTLVVWEELRVGDSEKGWFMPDYGRTQIILAPTSDKQTELLSRDPSSTYHIFSGTRGHPRIWNAFCQCLELNGGIGIRSESYQRGGIKGALRLFRSKYDALRFAKRIDFILAVGNMSVDWYTRIGYPEERVYLYAYVVEPPAFSYHQPTSEVLPSRLYDLVFVGRASHRKGLDILLRALPDTNKEDWRLCIVGARNDRNEYTKLSAELGLTDSVQFYDTLPNTEVIDLISRSDLLVLPSRWDGWGAVVNEALMCGVPVVCSDRCGAADLLDGGERGEVFPSGDISALRAILARRISQGKKDPETSERIRTWSKCIDGRAAADYLLAIVDAAANGRSRPHPPWLDPDQL